MQGTTSKILVSMTSYPGRIKNVGFSIFLLLEQQTLPPDEVHLWLAMPQFPNKEADLPKDERILVRLRHRAPLLPATFKNDKIILDEEVKTIAAGQSVVFYHDDICLGGGIVKG